MRSNYRRLGEFIEEIKIKNTELEELELLGVSVKKKFISSIANTVGTNFKKYKIVERNQFVYIPDTSRRGDKIGIAMLDHLDRALVSTAYSVFKITDHSELLPQYLMMWFTRTEFDRYARYQSHGSVREAFDWDAMCDVELPVPSLEKQQEIVADYNTVQDRIRINEQLNTALEETAQALYKHWFVDSIEKDSEIIELGELIDINGGYSYKGKELGEGSTFLLGMGSISFSSRFQNKGARLYSDDSPDKHLIYPGEIIIATRQQSENLPILGYPAMLPDSFEKERVIVGTNLFKVTNNSDINNEVIYQLLRSTSYREHIKLHAKGTTVSMITKDAIEKFSLRLPSRKNIDNLEKSLQPVVKGISINTKEINDYEFLCELLLSKMAMVMDEKELKQPVG